MGSYTLYRAHAAILLNDGPMAAQGNRQLQCEFCPTTITTGRAHDLEKHLRICRADVAAELIGHDRCKEIQAYADMKKSPVHQVTQYPRQCAEALQDTIYRTSDAEEFEPFPSWTAMSCSWRWMSAG
jgi:hypothetical protein